MSTYSAPPSGRLANAETNTLGLVGFVLGLVGLFATGGLLCPIALIISLVALGRRPRGFAIAGVILGFLGTCGGLIAILFFGAAILAALGIAAVAAVLSEPQKFEVTGDMAVIAAAVESNRAENGQLPLDLSALSIPAAVTMDPWGRPYDYVLASDAGSYDIVSAGVDGIEGTADDVRFRNLDAVWQSPGTVRISTSTTNGDGRVRVKIGEREINVDGSTGEVEVTKERRTPDSPPTSSPTPPSSPPSSAPGG